MAREKRDIRPVLVKFGVAVALSLGGILYSVLRTKRIKPSQSLPSPPPSEGKKAATKKDHHALPTASISSDSHSIAPGRHEESPLHKVSPDSSGSGISPSSRFSGDKDGFLLPEFNDLVKQFDLASKIGFSPKKDVETSHSGVETPRAFRHADGEENYEQEIKNLRNMVRNLRERERTLEIQLLEYCGLKEQETAVMELQNRLKINSVEAKLFSLKIESLQADKGRLEAQVADYAKVVVELDAARAKIKLLKKKLKSDTDQNKEQILILQQRVKKLQNQEHEAIASDGEIRLKLQRLKDLEEETEELKKSNQNLSFENSGLARKLDYTQMLANSVLEEDQEAEALKRESLRLRQQNEDLSKEIEQLQADRCGDVEELVYLRWLNACLRHELRNYNPKPGMTIARDLSKTLSPKSEEKAKQLIIEYASKEGCAEKGMNITDSDFDRWSSSHSYVTDSGDFEDSSADNSSANKTDTASKIRIFSKLKRLIRGKDIHRHRRRSPSLERTASAEFMAGDSSDSGALFRSSIDLGRLGRPKVEEVRDLGESSRKSDVSSCVYKSIILRSGSASDSPQSDQIHENAESSQKSELVKYAEVLKVSSRSSEPSKFSRRSSSHSSF